MPDLVGSFEFDLLSTETAFLKIGNAIFAGPRNAQIQDGMKAALNEQDEYCEREFVSASAGNGRWRPLAASTIKARRRAGQKYLQKAGGPLSKASSALAGATEFPILVITGQKLASLRQGDTYHALSWDNDSMWSGTFAPQIAFHQRGGGRLPSRPVLIPPDFQTKVLIARAVSVGVAAAIRAAIAF